jgi:membrane protein implicated in regulation of membrane protease activity
MSFDPPLIWFLVGLGLILLEFVIPGAIIVFFGVGAWIAALFSWLGVTSSLAWQLIIFSVSSVLLLLLLRRRLRAQFLGHSSGEQDLNDNLDEFVGHVVTVTDSIRAGAPGRVEFKGASWEARSEYSFQPGDRAVITDRDGIQILIGPMNPSSSTGQEASS